MSELRKRFEALPEIKNSLSVHIRIGTDGHYYTHLVNFEKLVAWLNGAWFIYQHQQAKIDELQKQNDWLNNVAERENERANKLQKENTGTLVLLGKVERLKSLLQSKNEEMQKRINGALSVCSENRLSIGKFMIEDETLGLICEFEKTLRGEHD